MGGGRIGSRDGEEDCRECKRRNKPAWRETARVSVGWDLGTGGGPTWWLADGGFRFWDLGFGYCCSGQIPGTSTTPRPPAPCPCAVEGAVRAQAGRTVPSEVHSAGHVSRRRRHAYAGSSSWLCCDILSQSTPVTVVAISVPRSHPRSGGSRKPALTHSTDSITSC